MTNRLRVVLAAAVLAASAVSHAGVTSLLSFGDSLSDVGNVALATTGALPGPAYFAGRFSNGPIWLDGLATGLGLPVTTPSLALGNNYAVGGSRVLQPNQFGPIASPSFSTVLAGYLSTSPTISPTTLVTVWIGSNDFLADPTALPDAAANATLTAGIVQGLTALRARGAQQFLVLNLPPVGLTPGIADVGLTAPVNAAVQNFNAQLAANVAAFGALPNTKVTLLDTYSLLTGAVAAPGAFGFTNVTDSAFDGATVNPNASTYLWWDDTHPTTQGHAILAAAALQAIPEPTALVALLPAIAITSRRRR